jgi:hypothetical protein
MRLDGLQKWCGQFGDEESLLPLQRIEPLFLGWPSRRYTSDRYLGCSVRVALLPASCLSRKTGQEFGAMKSPRQLAVDLQLQQGGVGQGRRDISSVGKPLLPYISPPNVRSMNNTNHFHRMLCDILVACPCVRYPWTVMSSSSPTQEYSIPLENVFRPLIAFSWTWGAWILKTLHRLEFLSEN